MNKIGFNLLAWSAYASSDLYPTIERLKQIGYDGIEFSMGNRNPTDYRELGRFLEQLGLQATAVNAPTPEANPASPDAAIRQKAVDRHKEDIDMAREAGATILCAFFIATDPVSAATSPKGRFIYGLGIGLLIFAIRRWGSYADGVAFAVLIMNMATPAIDYVTRPHIVGHARRGASR